jgi:hypothetical protein
VEYIINYYFRQPSVFKKDDIPKWSNAPLIAIIVLYWPTSLLDGEEYFVCIEAARAEMVLRNKERIVAPLNSPLRKKWCV